MYYNESLQEKGKKMEQLANWVRVVTTPLVETKIGKWILSAIIFVGPLSFLPTVMEAWTNPDIDAFRTLTWPTMVVVNLAFFVSLCHQGDNKTRSVMIIWVVLMASVWVATLVR